MRIMLFCAAGISTNMLVSKMEKEVTSRGLENVVIKAVGEIEFEKEMDQYDVCLLGPQVRYLLRRAKELGTKHQIPVEAIQPLDYGTVNAKKVLDLALSLYEKKNIEASVN